MKWSTWSLVIGLLGLSLAGYQTCTLKSGRADLVRAAKDAAESEAEESLPELHFNIQLKRNVLDSLIAGGIPMLVVLLMLFAIIVRRTENTEVSKLFGFNPPGTVRICSGLFFVVLLAHIQMRNSIQAEEIVLLEYMYFIVHLAILFTAWHTFLFFSDTRLKIFTYRESLITKLLFWPVVLGLQLAVAVVFLF